MSTLKSLTKAELIALVQERNATIVELRHEVSIARMPKAPTPARVAYMARPKSTEPTPFQLACAAAKAAALAGGIVTRVAA